MKLLTRILMALGIVFVVAWFFLLPNLASTGRPTAKELAYRRCLDYARYVRYAATNDEFTLDVSKLANVNDPNHSEPWKFINLLSSAKDLPMQREDYLVKTNCVTSKTNREVVIVCEKKFDFNKVNTSFWNFFKRNYAHAVGYSDGSVEIISRGELAKLDMHGFTRLSQVASNTLPILFGK